MKYLRDFLLQLKTIFIKIPYAELPSLQIFEYQHFSTENTALFNKNFLKIRTTTFF